MRPSGRPVTRFPRSEDIEGSGDLGRLRGREQRHDLAQVPSRSIGVSAAVPGKALPTIAEEDDRDSSGLRPLMLSATRGPRDDIVQKIKSEPWNHYTMTRDNNGEIIATREGRTYSIKKHKKPGGEIEFRRSVHKNVLELLDVFQAQSSIFIVYEYQEISLADIDDGPHILREEHAAWTCKEVLKGLRFIHDELLMSHGSVTCVNIFITEEGEARIGAFGSSQIESQTPRGMERDIESVGAVMCQLICPGVILARAGPPAKDLSKHAHEFWNRTRHLKAGKLLKHPFLNLAEKISKETMQKIRTDTANAKLPRSDNRG